MFFDGAVKMGGDVFARDLLDALKAWRRVDLKHLRPSAPRSISTPAIPKAKGARGSNGGFSFLAGDVHADRRAATMEVRAEIIRRPHTFHRSHHFAINDKAANILACGLFDKILHKEIRR